MSDDTILTNNRLQSILLALSDRDKELLKYLLDCRYLTAMQIQRLLFTDAANTTAGLRAANRCLNKLQTFGLADALSRPIGGVRAGSKSRAWFITDGGNRLLRLAGVKPRARRRSFEPSVHHLLHTIGVAECLVQLTEICAGDGLSLTLTETEPDCWRMYSDKGKQVTLRPDLFAVTECGNYHDRWFFEIDLRTEAPIRILEKCRVYHDYYKTGLEQKEHGVFPLVVWVVLDDARKETFMHYIRTEFRNHHKIFTVITPNELEKLIRQGVDGSILC